MNQEVKLRCLEKQRLSDFDCQTYVHLPPVLTLYVNLRKLTPKFYLGRLPTFLDVQESPFDKKMYTPADADKFLMQTENTIRWRMNDKVIERLHV
jgi:hypothetical protein